MRPAISFSSFLRINSAASSHSCPTIPHPDLGPGGHSKVGNFVDSVYKSSCPAVAYIKAAVTKSEIDFMFNDLLLL